VSNTVEINGRIVGPGHPAYSIAETGSNHDQDKGRALDMIAQAAACGVDAVKFQSLKFDEIYLPEHETAEFRDWFAAIQLPEDWYADLAKCSKGRRRRFSVRAVLPGRGSLVGSRGRASLQIGRAPGAR